MITKAYPGTVTHAEFNVFIMKCLDAGMDVNAKDNNGCPLLIHATMNQNNTLLERLVLDKNIKINDVDKRLNSALHIAATQYNVEAIKKLVANGASVDIRNLAGKTPAECLPANASAFIRAMLSGEEDNYAAYCFFSPFTGADSNASPNPKAPLRRIGLAAPSNAKS